MLKYLAPILILFTCLSCSSSDELDPDTLRRLNSKGEYIYRLEDESMFTVPSPEKNTPEPYPWEERFVGDNPKITKEYFRCKGCSLNPAYEVLQRAEKVRIADCGGSDKHSLPLKDGKEFIYTILLELMNYIQERTGKRVIITSGHRCPTHNAYVDQSPSNRYSKHMIGGEVSFYVEGMEAQPQQIVDYLQEFYTQNPEFEEQNSYTTFKRYEKDDTNVSTPPWYNKEVFIKLFKKDEGRNFDNRHPYPYIAIQVRYDRETQKRVVYNWDLAYRNYLRW